MFIVNPAIAEHTVEILDKCIKVFSNGYDQIAERQSDEYKQALWELERIKEYVKAIHPTHK